MSGGWIRLHRKLADRPIWTQEKFTKGQAWVDLILQASYQDHIEIQGNSFLTVKRGQLFTSQALLSKRWRWNRETVRLFLRLLRDLNMVAIRTAKETETGYTLITLLNYDLYQGDSTDAKALPPAVDSAIRPPSESRNSPENSAVRSAIGKSQDMAEYTGTYEKLSEAPPPSDPPSIPPSDRHPTRHYQEGKKGKKEKEPLVVDERAFWEKFSPQDQEIIHQTIKAIHSTRKRGEAAESVIQGELRWWDLQEPARVIQGMQIYLQKGYAAYVDANGRKSKDEKYLRGIIKRCDGRAFSPGGDPSPHVGQKASLSPGAEAIRRAALSMTEEDTSG